MATGRVPTTANSPLTAKGDLFTYSTAPARLAVGNNGEQIVADSAATTGLRYSATPSASNPVLNSAFQVWQRGTSFSLAASSANIYTADRWILLTQTNEATTISRQATGDTTNLPNIQYNLRFQRNSGQTGTLPMYLCQNFETINSIPFAGKTVTMSFYARKGADYSPTSSLLGVNISSGTGTDQNIFNGITGQSLPIDSSVTLTTTWQRFTVTGTIPTTSTELQLYFTFTPTGTASTNDYFDITGVQLDVGSVALPFRTYAATIQGELAAAQRYFYLVASGSGQLIANGLYVSATQFSSLVPLPVTMRSTPTLSVVTGTNYYDTYNGGSDLLNSLTIFSAGTTVSGVFNSSEAAGTQYRPAYLETNNAAAFVAFSAEL